MRGSQMLLTELTTDDLLRGLAHRNDVERREYVREFQLRWTNKLVATCSHEQTTWRDVAESRTTLALFTIEPKDIRLRAMDDLRCLLVAGDGEVGLGLDQEVIRWATAPGRISLILTVSESLHHSTRSLFPGIEFLVLSKNDIRAVLDAEYGQVVFKKLLRERVPKRALMPYNYLMPASSNMFFGRSDGLDKLMNQPSVSFAIAGPSRLGKTSLVRQYERRLVWQKDGRAHCRYYIDFMDCGDKTDDGIARFIATKVSPKSSTLHTRALGSYNPRGPSQRSILSFFVQMKHELGRPPELLLDEVDEVCLSTTFDLLGEAAKLGLVRLIVCGRGVLFRAMHKPNSPLANRLELLLLEPLSQGEANELAVKPIEDLGFRIPDPERFGIELFHHTKGLPHLIQYFGHKIIEMAMRNGTETITAEMVRNVAGDYDTVQVLIRPYRQLKGDHQKIAAGMIKSGLDSFTVRDVREIGGNSGIILDDEGVVDFCNDLFVEGFLVWAEGRYALSSSALPTLLFKMGLVT